MGNDDCRLNNQNLTAFSSMLELYSAYSAYRFAFQCDKQASGSQVTLNTVRFRDHPKVLEVLFHWLKVH